MIAQVCTNEPITTGTSTVCTSNSTFDILNIPAGQIANWSVSPSNLVNIASGTGTSATFQAKNNYSSGQATITFTLSGGASCPSNATFPKTFWVGKPPSILGGYLLGPTTANPGELVV